MCRDPKNPQLCKDILKGLRQSLKKLVNERAKVNSGLGGFDLTDKPEVLSGRNTRLMRRNLIAFERNEGEESTDNQTIDKLAFERNEGEESTDNQTIDELAFEISQLLTSLLTTNQDGALDRDLMAQRSLQLGKLATKLLEISLDRVEIDNDSIEVKQLNNIIYTLLLQVV